MNKIQMILIFLLIFISVIMWIVSVQQYDTMMSSMMMITFYNPTSLLLFTAIWTAGMAAMMFPAIAPMVLLYDRLIKSNNSNNAASGIGEGKSSSSLIVGKEEEEEEEEEEERQGIKKSASSLLSSLSWSAYPFKMVLFVGSYLVVWALIGIAILIGWSILMNYFFFMETFFSTKEQQHLDVAFGVLLIISGLYQFSSLKTKCLGYCESPMSFFMRRWRNGMVGAVKMGTYHGLYCLGCCWPYFLLMVALGWMNLLSMALFAAIIIAEKVWIRGGRWVARSVGAGFIILGVLVFLGIIEPSSDGMEEAEEEEEEEEEEEASKENTATDEEDTGMNMMDMNMGSNKGGGGGDDDDNDMQMNMDVKDNDDMGMKMK
jgi:predicted metal-binding membrane protein